MIPADDVREALQAVVEREGGAPPGWEQQIARFVDLLTQWNQRFNLVSRSTVDQALTAHVLPSLAALVLVRPDRELRALDVGSGGGFPGIPLRILRPRMRLDLVDATRKKCRFLERCVEELALEDTRVHWCRIESPSPDLLSRAPFDLAVARAVGAETRVAEAARDLLSAEGEAWAFVSPEAPGADHVWVDPNGRAITALGRLA